MAISIQNTYIDTYDGMVTTLAQQQLSLILPHVFIRSEHSKNHRFSTIGSVNMTSSVKASGRFSSREDTSFTDTPWGGRLVGVKRARIADSIEIHDEPQMGGIINGPSHITRAHGYAAARQLDDWIIAAATGTATSHSGSSVAFPAAQKKSVNISGSTKLNAEWWAEILEQYAQNNASEAMKIVVVPPELISHMYSIDEYKSRDYTHNPLHMLMSDGLLPNWMGFHWIVSTRLLKTNSNKNYTAFVFQPMSIGFKMNMPMRANIAIRHDKWDLTQFSCQMLGDAVRIEDNRVMSLNIQVKA